MTTGKPRASFKTTPEDFVVEEVPLYAPSGEGEHVFVRFTKRDRTTEQAVRAICDALGANARDAGIAGMKDKRAVTTQTISVQAPRGTPPKELAERARALSLEAITIHEATPHANKIKPGHLAANRFAIALRGIDPARVEEVRASLARAAQEGIPNFYGAQRFGASGDNAARALAWLRGEEKGPRDPRARRLAWSSLQSAIFNAVLARRIEEGTWNVPMEGDLLKRRTSGGLFVCTDVQTDRDRATRGEVSPTGPMLGVKMRSPEGAPAELERRVAAEILGENFDLTRTKPFGEGTRRDLRLWIEELRTEDIDTAAAGEQGSGMRVYFVLPKGAYATTVLETTVELHEAGRT